AKRQSPHHCLVVPARGTPRRERRGDPVAGTHNHRLWNMGPQHKRVYARLPTRYARGRHDLSRSTGSYSPAESGRVHLVFILEQVLNGLLVGAYYLLIALGLSLIFALGGIVNLAHSGFYAIGAYLAVVLADRIGFAGALVVSPLAVGLIGVAIERLLFRR